MINKEIITAASEAGLPALKELFNKLSKEDALKERQWLDEYKKQYALSQGYYYLEIPYTAEKDDEYKQLIDDKINEIA